MKASNEILLLRLRNPWGFVEYRGPWSDKWGTSQFNGFCKEEQMTSADLEFLFCLCVCDYSGKEWDEVDEAEKKRIDLKKKEDGEFWYVAKTHHTMMVSVSRAYTSTDDLKSHSWEASIWICTGLYIPIDTHHQNLSVDILPYVQTVNKLLSQSLRCPVSVVSIRISTEDLSRLFDIVELCSVNPDTLVEGQNPLSPSSPSSPTTWTISEHEGCWVSGSSAGGSRRYNSMFVTSRHQLEPEIVSVIVSSSIPFHLSNLRVILEESSVPADSQWAGPVRGWGWRWGRRRWRWQWWRDDPGGEKESWETEEEIPAVHGGGGAAAEKPPAEGQSPLPLHSFPRLQGHVSNTLSIDLFIMPALSMFVPLINKLTRICMLPLLSRFLLRWVHQDLDILIISLRWFWNHLMLFVMRTKGFMFPPTVPGGVSEPQLLHENSSCGAFWEI